MTNQTIATTGTKTASCEICGKKMIMGAQADPRAAAMNGLGSTLCPRHARLVAKESDARALEILSIANNGAQAVQVPAPGATVKLDKHNIARIRQILTFTDTEVTATNWNEVVQNTVAVALASLQAELLIQETQKGSDK